MCLLVIYVSDCNASVSVYEGVCVYVYVCVCVCERERERGGGE